LGKPTESRSEKKDRGKERDNILSYTQGNTEQVLVAHTRIGGQIATTERDRMKFLGFTEEEAECWMLAASVAGAFFHLPALHPMDEHEVAHAIHVVQNKLHSRPTYRRHLECY